LYVPARQVCFTYVLYRYIFSLALTLVFTGTTLICIFLFIHCMFATCIDWQSIRSANSLSLLIENAGVYCILPAYVRLLYMFHVFGTSTA
jgi:hypothetical protein